MLVTAGSDDDVNGLGVLGFAKKATAEQFRAYWLLLDRLHITCHLWVEVGGRQLALSAWGRFSGMASTLKSAPPLRSSWALVVVIVRVW